MATKFDPAIWEEVMLGERISLPSSGVRVNTSHPACLHVRLLPLESEEKEPELPLFVVAGYGTAFDLEVGPGGPVEFFLSSADGDCRAFFVPPPTTAREARLGSFTNVDRPFDMQSEAYDAVYGVVRQLQYELKQQALVQQREGRAQARLNARLLAEREEAEGDQEEVEPEPVLDEK